MQAIPIRAGVLRFPFRLDGVGAISGILALLVSGAQVWHDVMREPDTVAMNAGASVDLTYDPVQKQVTLLFPVLLQNNGSRDDVLADLQAQLNERATWDAEHISVSESGQVAVAQRTPIALRLGSSRLSLSVVSLHEGVLEVGNNRIDLTLRTPHLNLPLGYCFALTDAQMNEMRTSAQIWTRTMTRTDCHPQGGEGKST